MNSEMFLDVYGHSPTVRVFCPGHLNLIGEQIAEHGFPTISMATDTGTEILAAVNDRAEICIKNTDEEYKPCTMHLPTDWNGTTCPEWFDYLLAGWKGVVERLKTDAIGFDILMEEELATLCANAEQYVGQRGDRTIHLTQVLGCENMAVRFDYYPLRPRLVAMPPIAVFDVLNCGEKHNTPPFLREQRFAEGLIAGKEALAKRSEEMITLCATLPETATREELLGILEPQDLDECLAEGVDYATPFKLRSVARHVFSEALRVEKFERACETRDLFEMGKVFNESHDSCRRDFECSSKAADRLVAECRMARAYGARVSGYSGTVVALIDDIRPVYLGDNLIYHAFSSPGASIEFL
ncbi:unnamed protein product [Heligmosomoides polygyrus]|uniref:GalKase_gal_bdg domain-containing protein n=1 Tax=Heligmosomoides polygyrus TaxID=6339 RepID=A0A3P8AZZ6_HELPZ|nr:unnamed protein product [Heligmosomoides polygyrus]